MTQNEKLLKALEYIISKNPERKIFLLELVGKQENIINCAVQYEDSLYTHFIQVTEDMFLPSGMKHPLPEPSENEEDYDTLYKEAMNFDL